MAFDRHVIDGKERLVWTCRAFDFRLFANPPLPFIRTGRCVAAAPRLAILPTDGEDIRTAAEKPSEQGNLVFDCRIPIDEIAGFFRRDNFDSSGLLTRCRLQGLDLGYDRRALALMRLPTAAQSAELSRDRALRRNAGVEKPKRSRDIRNRAVHDAIYYRETPADAPLIDAELLFRQPEPALSVNCSGSHVRVIPGYGARSQCKSL